jgi:SnoaL-like protein
MVAESESADLSGPSGRAPYSERNREMSLEETRQVITAYLQNHGDPGLLAENAVFRDMGTGQEYRGPDAIAQSLEYFYRQAFEAHPEVHSTVIDDGHAVAEGEFVGRHIGDFAGYRPPDEKSAFRSALPTTWRGAGSREHGSISSQRRRAG